MRRRTSDGDGNRLRLKSDHAGFFPSPWRNL